MRLIFMGTPSFAVPTLERLAQHRGWQLTAAVCQPDRPVGRSGALEPPAVKRAAANLGLEVYQPERMRGDAPLAWLRAQRPDALVVVAFGQILPAAIFDLAQFGAINAHASLLPAYRGAAPIQWVLARGETRTGVTTMRINAGLDTGDMLLRRSLDIGPTETAVELSPRLAALSATLMEETLEGLAAGAIIPQPQLGEGTLAPILTRADGLVDWTASAQEIYNHWRGFQPWPGLHTRFRGKQLAILACRALSDTDPGAAPGTLRLDPGPLLTVACGRGRLALETVRLEGRQPVLAAAFAHGARFSAGEGLV